MQQRQMLFWGLFSINPSPAKNEDLGVSSSGWCLHSTTKLYVTILRISYVFDTGNRNDNSASLSASH